jgi:uncharacterized protein (DUF427 family)
VDPDIRRINDMEETSMGRREPESVWDYPRPPRLEASARTLKIVHAGVLIAETKRSMRILETSHPPVYYIPQADIAMEMLKASSRRGSFCEFKGVATYWNLTVIAEYVEDVAWSYASPSRSYLALKDFLAFYASRVDECWVDGERVVAQPGDFYGGWITSHVTGPFKGAPGTLGW